MESLRAKRPLEVVFYKFVTLDKSSDNRENVLILTVVFFTKFVRWIPTKDQSAVNSGSTYMVYKKWYSENFQSKLSEKFVSYLGFSKVE